MSRVGGFVFGIVSLLTLGFVVGNQAESWLWQMPPVAALSSTARALDVPLGGMTGAPADPAVDWKPRLHDLDWLTAPPGEQLVHWPVDAVGVNSLFGKRMHPVKGQSIFHYGVDFAVDYGRPVKTVLNGVVRFAGPRGGHGNHVIVDHAGGYSSAYSHLSEINVTAGQWVDAGDLVGAVGDTGQATGPHLHFEMSRHGAHLNPMRFVGAQIALGACSPPVDGVVTCPEGERPTLDYARAVARTAPTPSSPQRGEL